MVSSFFLINGYNHILYVHIIYPLVNIQKAMENGPVEIVDFPMKNGGSFHCYVSSPEGNRPYSSDHGIYPCPLGVFFSPGSSTMVTIPFSLSGDRCACKDHIMSSTRT